MPAKLENMADWGGGRAAAGKGHDKREEKDSGFALHFETSDF